MKLIKYGIPKRFGCIARNIKWAFQMRKGVNRIGKSFLGVLFAIDEDKNVKLF